MLCTSYRMHPNLNVNDAEPARGLARSRFFDAAFSSISFKVIAVHNLKFAL